MSKKDTVEVEATTLSAAEATEETGAEVGVEELCHETKVAKASEIIKRNMLWSAGAGVLPVPVLELVAVTTVELKLVKELADLYETGYRKDLAKAAVLSLIGSLGSATLGKMLAMSSLRAIPVLGHAVAVASVPAFAAAVTYAIGRVFVAHFETGGTLLDFDSTKVREYFRNEFAAGMKKAAATVAPAPAKAEAAA